MDSRWIPVDDIIVSTHVHENRALVTVTGEVDAFNARVLEDALQLLGSHGIRHFLIDMEGVRFCDSHGVRAIARLLAEYPPAVITVAGASRLTQQLMHMTGLDTGLSLAGRP